MKASKKMLKPKKLPCSLSHTPIFSLCTSSTYNVLFLGIPSDERVPEINTISRYRTNAIRSSCPVIVYKHIEANIRGWRVEHTLTRVILYVSENTMCCSQLNIGWSGHKLTQIMHREGDVRTCDRQIKKPTNKSTIRRRIKQRLIRIPTEFNQWIHRNQSRL